MTNEELHGKEPLADAVDGGLELMRRQAWSNPDIANRRRGEL